MKKLNSLVVCSALAIVASGSVAAEGNWQIDDGFFNGVGFRHIFQPIAEQTAMAFTFSENNENCINSFSVRFPIDPINQDRHQASLFCSYIVDDGVNTQAHAFECFSHANAGADYIAVMTKPTTPPLALTALTQAVEGSTRVGFQANGGEPFWYDSHGLAEQLEKGFEFCH